MTNSDEVSLSRYTLTDDGEFLRLCRAPGVTMEAEDIHSTIAAVTAASPEGKRPLLVNIGLVERITMEAKQMLIDDTCSTRTAVVGVDEVSRVLTAFNYRSATPSRYFTEESEASAWLLEDAEPDNDPDGATGMAEPFTADMRGEVLWVEFDTGAEVKNTVAAALLDRVNRLSPSVCPPTPLVAAKALDLNFHACQGAVTKDFYEARNNTWGEARQLDHLGEDTGLVTLSIGGNDAKFGLIDQVVHVRTQDLGLAVDATQLCLTGQLDNGRAISSCDAVSIR